MTCGCPQSSKKMKAYYIAEHDHQESEVRWVRAVENYRDAEAANAEAVHALKDAKIAVLLRRLRAPHFFSLDECSSLFNVA
jgi:cupin superfamily acireductone dioxygenase involved in methionine salvage